MRRVLPSLKRSVLSALVAVAAIEALTAHLPDTTAQLLTPSPAPHHRVVPALPFGQPSTA
ncbi:hypothetical protein [Aquabacterium sp.]|uniref:hypothetical protein n=1 Tax=Aquabacterium sp. TaxID=1872578 RepID=UPI00248A14B0|nr:hypothetical protein [Aquabacterium sp.]MDI1259351.1 hypothetical protein [Aquabacterium sp.]